MGLLVWDIFFTSCFSDNKILGSLFCFPRLLLSQQVIEKTFCLVKQMWLQKLSYRSWKANRELHVGRGYLHTHTHRSSKLTNWNINNIKIVHHHPHHIGLWLQLLMLARSCLQPGSVMTWFPSVLVRCTKATQNYSGFSDRITLDWRPPAIF